jgi:hypothetical protein
MRKLLLLTLLIPALIISQNSEEYAVFENGMITANPTKIKQFESGMAAHNKKYHAQGIYGARVYWISNGTNVGKYIWAMGPLPWSAFDSRPKLAGHDEDWNKNVLPYMLADGDQTYWKFEAKLSNFPKDFNISKLLVDIYDIKRFQKGKVLKLLKKIDEVMKTKLPDESYGMYTNELPSTKDGRDLAFVSFFEKMSWMGEDNKFYEKYNEVHGDGSFGYFLKDWGELTNGSQSEIWIYREDLSGLGAKVNSAARQ